MSRGRKPTAKPVRSPEIISFAADDDAGEMLAVVHGLGPRDLKLISALIAKVRQVELERGETAARQVVEAIAALLMRRGLSGG